MFVNDGIVILLRGKCPKAKLEVADNKQYAKTGRGGAAWQVKIQIDALAERAQ